MRFLRRVSKPLNELSSASSAADEMAHRIGPVADRVTATAQGLAESATHAAGRAAGWFSRRSRKLALNQGMVGETGRLVGAYPLTSLAVVFVAGVLLAKALR